MRRALTATVLTATALLGGAATATADDPDEIENSQGLGIQICQLPINVIPIVSPITSEQDDCLNSSTVVGETDGPYYEDVDNIWVLDEISDLNDDR
jgi:hypothetical protein